MSGLWVCMAAFAAVSETESPAGILHNAAPPAITRGASDSELYLEPSSLADQLRYATTAAEHAAKSRNLMAWKWHVNETLTSAAKLQATDLPRAAAQVLHVYQELQQATQLRPQDRDDLRQQLRNRLIALQPKLLERIPKSATILAQQLPLGRNAVAKGSDPGEQLLEAIKTIKPAQWVDQGGPGVAVLWQFGVPPVGPGAFGRQGFGPNGRPNGLANGQPPDHGQELVDLIQAVIAPQSWEANGGPGVIRYYAPARALVIRQTGNGHEQLNGLLNQLRR